MATIRRKMSLIYGWPETLVGGPLRHVGLSLATAQKPTNVPRGPRDRGLKNDCLRDKNVQRGGVVPRDNPGQMTLPGDRRHALEQFAHRVWKARAHPGVSALPNHQRTPN